MSDMPEEIWAIHVWIDDATWYECFVPGTEKYIRADIHEARVKELEAVLNKLWRRQDSLDTFDAAVNAVLAPLFEKQTYLGTSATAAIFDDLVSLYEE